MKYIFDFDDVLFHNTKQFKEHMYKCLEVAGVSRKVAEEYYKTVRGNKFWLKDLLTHFSLRESLYEEILNKSERFANEDLMNIIKKLGKANCFIVSLGNEEFQRAKIKISGIEPHFSEIVVVSESKKEAVEKICAKHRDEKIIFIDDKDKHFENLDYKKYPNLKTILYTGQSAAELLAQINE